MNEWVSEQVSECLCQYIYIYMLSVGSGDLWRALESSREDQRALESSGELQIELWGALESSGEL